MMAGSENMSRLNNLYNQEDDKCQVSDGADKRRKASRIIGWGLRRFSTIVCRKVEAKGRTTYNEVADEIIAELTSLEKIFDEKNIRRRVYDAFNVLLAINVIAKDKKEMRWIGFPSTPNEDLQALKEMHMNLMNRIQKKASFLKELEEKFVGRQNLLLRNQLSQKSGNFTNEGVALPFLLVQTSPKATVEIEISEDMRSVNFDFNGTPFTLHDDASILKEMRYPMGENQNAAQNLSESSNLITNPSRKQIQPTLL